MSPGGYDFGGLGNSGDRARLDWSSTSTRGGSAVTRTPAGWPAGEFGGRQDWSSSNSKAGTRGLWGGEYDWSRSSTRGVGAGLDKLSDATSAPTGKVVGRLDWSSSNAGTRGVWGGDYDWSTSSTRGATRTPAPTGGVAERLDWSSSNAGTRGVWGGNYDWSTSSTRGPGARLGMGGMGCGNMPCSPQGQWNGGASGIINSPSLPPIPWPNVVCGSSCYSQAYCYSCQQWGSIVPVSPG